MMSITPRLRTLVAGLALAAGSAVAAQAAGADTPESAAVPVLANSQHYLYTDGKALYGALCQACHQDKGQGAVGAAAYPALAGNQTLEAPAYPVHMVLNGHNAMPGFKDYLDDAQVAAVVTYVRTHFGNAYSDPVTDREVAQSRH